MSQSFSTTRSRARNFTSQLAAMAGDLCGPDCKREVKGWGEPQGVVWGAVGG